MKPNSEKDFIKNFVISDLHGTLLDENAFSCVLQVLTENPVDTLYINGDLLDLPWLMSADKHKISFEDKHVTVKQEIEYTIDRILKPLRKALGSKSKIKFILGNHDDRIVRINSNNKQGLKEIVQVAQTYDCIHLPSLLRFKEFGITWDRGVKKQGRYTDTVFLQQRTSRKKDRGVIVHGFYGGKNLKNYLNLYHSSGTSGHTHKMRREVHTWYEGEYIWQESGCLCRKSGVEYLPVGAHAEWTHGFVTIWISKKDRQLFIKGHPIQNYTLDYKGQFYTPTSYA